MGKLPLVVTAAICVIVLVWAAAASAQGAGAGLTVTPVGSALGDGFIVSADKCPDPDEPRLGGGYRVRFQISYLIPPDSNQASFEETSIVWTEQDGTASTTLTVLDTAPRGTYRITATCELEELGAIAQIFLYGSVDVEVTGPEPTATVTVEPTATAEPTATPGPTATATVEPTATAEPTATPGPTVTPGPTATVTVEPTATAEPTATPGPTSTVEPTATPGPAATPAPTAVAPTATATPGGGTISFTG